MLYQRSLAMTHPPSWPGFVPPAGPKPLRRGEGPAIHVFAASTEEVVDARDKPGHDESRVATVGVTLHGVVFDIFGMPSRRSRTRPPSPKWVSAPVRLRIRFAQATPDTLHPYGPAVAAPRVARQGEAWWARQDSNLQPDRYERPALTIELQALGGRQGQGSPARIAAAPFTPAAAIPQCRRWRCAVICPTGGRGKNLSRGRAKINIVTCDT
jgi:hypothetical protein